MPENSHQLRAHCNRCGADNFDFASFCIACGSALGEGVEDPAREADALESAPLGAGEQPTPLVRRRLSPSRLRLLEAAVGLVILLLVSGYALFNWLQSTSQYNSYYDGLSAEQRMDWDSAVQGFLQAGDFKDAARREAAAQQKVTGRDTLYKQALEAEGRQEWAAEIDALGKLQLIQPSYRDVAARISRARTQAYATGLDGLIYLVDRGSAAGLYIRDEEGRAIRVPGSDASSLVRAISPEGDALVYDRPAAPSDVCSNSDLAPSSRQQGSPGITGRRRIAVVARLDGDAPVSEQALPCFAGDGNGAFTGAGIWWYNQISSRGEVYYQSNNASLPAQRISDLSAGKRVIAMDAARSRVVIARAVPIASAGNWQTELSLAEADGRNAQLLSTLPGQVTQASVSEDGKWLLLVVRLNTTSVEQAVVILPITPGGGPSRPRFGSAWPRNAIQLGNSLPAPSVGAVFVPSSDGHSRAAVSYAENGRSTLAIYDLATGTTSYSWVGTGLNQVRPELAGLSPDGAFLAFRGQQGEEASVAVVSLKVSGAAAPSELQVEALPQQNVQLEFVPHSAYALLTVTSPEDGPRIAPSLYTLHLTGQGTVGSPSLLARIHWPHLAGAPSTSLAQGSYLLAYITPSDELHAVFVDGTGDTTLAESIGAIWSLHRQPGAIR